MPLTDIMVDASEEERPKRKRMPNPWLKRTGTGYQPGQRVDPALVQRLFGGQPLRKAPEPEQPTINPVTFLPEVAIEAGKTLYRNLRPYSYAETGIPPARDLAQQIGRIGAGFTGLQPEPATSESEYRMRIANEPAWQQALAASTIGAPLESLGLGLTQMARTVPEAVRVAGGTREAARKVWGGTRTALADQTGGVRLPGGEGKLPKKPVVKPKAVTPAAGVKVTPKTAASEAGGELLKKPPRNIPYREVRVNLPKQQVLDEFKADLAQLRARLPGENAVNASLTRMEIKEVQNNIRKVMASEGNTVAVRRYQPVATSTPAVETAKGKPPEAVPPEVGANKVISYDPSINRYNNQKLTPGDLLIDDKGTQYTLDRANGFMLTLLKRNAKGGIDTISVSVDPFDKSRYMALTSLGENVYGAIPDRTISMNFSQTTEAAKVKPPVEVKPKPYTIDIVQPARGVTGETKTVPTRVTPAGDYVVGKQPSQYGAEVTYGVYDKQGKLIKGGFDKHSEAVADAVKRSGKPPVSAAEGAAVTPETILAQTKAKPTPSFAHLPPRPVDAWRGGWEGKLPTEEADIAASAAGGVPPKFPSGRVPGGPAGKLPPVTPDNYKLLQESLTPDNPPIRQRITETVNRILRAGYWNGYSLRKLAKESGIPVDDTFQVIRGHMAAGENEVRLTIKPILDNLDWKLVQRWQEYMTLMTEQDLVGRAPAALLPGGIQGRGGIVEAINTLKRNVGGAKFAKIEAAAEAFWKETDRQILRVFRTEGIIDADGYVRIKADNPHYVSLAREDFSDLVGQAEQRMNNAAASLASTGLDLRSLAGSTRKLDDPVARAIANMIRAPMVAARNRAARAIGQALREVQGAEDGELFHILKPGETGENSKIKQTISWWEDGKQIRVEVPAEFGVVAKNAEAEATNAFSRFFSAIGRPLQAGATTYNPAFVAMNPWWDMISGAFRVKGYGPWRKDYWRGWAAALWKNENFNDAARAGVFQSGLVESARSIKDITRMAGRGTFTVRSFGDAAKLIPRMIQEAAITGERATRVGGYLYLKGKGYSELEAAIKGGRDITVDFSKSGTVMKLINTAIPFSNAGVQGLANIGRTVRDDPKQLLRVGAPLAFISAMARLNNARFESASKISPELYYRNWVFVVGEYTENPDPKHPEQKPETFPIIVKIPKGPLAGPAMMPVETLLDIAFKNDNRSVAEMALSTTKGVALAASPFSPDITGIMPPLAGTAVQLATGQNVYGGRPIIPERERNLLPEQQFGAETSKIAVLLGQKFRVSPRLIDFAIRDYTAGTGTTVSWMAGMGLEAVGFRPETYGAAFAQEPTGIQKLSYVPAISRVLSTSGTRLENEAWEDLDKATESTKRLMVTSIPEMNRLGVTFGQVGTTIQNQTIDTKTRAAYQSLSGQVAQRRIGAVIESPYYQQVSDGEKKGLIQDAMQQGRDAAKLALYPVLKGKPVDQAQLDGLARAIENMLTPYWQVESQIWATYSQKVRQAANLISRLPQDEQLKYLEKWPSILRARQEIARRKRDLREANPSMDILLKRL